MKNTSFQNIEKENFSKIRAQIRAGRELLGMNQTQLAQFMGVSLSKISRAEAGEVKTMNVLLEIQKALESAGIRFTSHGVELHEDRLEIIEGEGCYARLLDDVYKTLQKSEHKEFLVIFASDSKSPSAINMRYRTMLKEGMTFRKLISDADTYIMGDFESYRTIPSKYFSNVVTVVYENKIAQVNGVETRITIQSDPILAERERKIFGYLWHLGGKPLTTTAKERYDTF